MKTVLKYLLLVHLTALFSQSILRILLYLFNLHQVADIEDKGSLLFQALLKGIQFDNVISCYIIALPLVLLSIAALINRLSPLLVKFTNVYFLFIYFFVFAISMSNIPYFSYYFTYIGVSVLNWAASGETYGMILTESSYYIFFLIFIILYIAFYFACSFIGRKAVHEIKTSKPQKFSVKIFFKYFTGCLLLWGLCFIGIRGTLRIYPIRIGNAYFSDSPFFNQLGINPVFYLIKSSSSKQKSQTKIDTLINEKDAIQFTQNKLGINNPNETFPLSREVQFEQDTVKPNIVIVLMESFSSNYLELKYKDEPLTPNIHKLIKSSYYFPNFYSAGVHTNNGIAATLYGYPPIFDKKMMNSEPDYFDGLPTSLKTYGYQNTFFVTSNPQYDNMNSFLHTNGIKQIYSLYDYPSEKSVNQFGVQDDYLFEFGIDKLNEMAQSDRPFFTTFLTVSNHPPYHIPEKFKEYELDDSFRIVAFADYAIGQFIEEASKQEWYKNTIFVFLGDHGKIFGEQPYDMSLSYNHVPLIIHSPLFEDAPKEIDVLGGQVDVYPTIMGMLKLNYTNNSMGIDLMREKREYMFFVSDSHLGCVDKDLFYCYNAQAQTEFLYNYRNGSNKNIFSENEDKAAEMRKYAASMMATGIYMIENKRTSIQHPPIEVAKK